MNFTLAPLTRAHYNKLYSIVDTTLSSGTGWNIKSLENAESILEYIYESHENDGFFWVIVKQEEVLGFTGVVWRDDMLCTGYSSITYLCPSARGTGINQACKEAMQHTLALQGETLYARIAKGNERSLKAMRKYSHNIPGVLETVGRDETGKEFVLFSLPAPSSQSLSYWVIEDIEKMSLELRKGVSIKRFV